jgi:ABC-type sulfate/molybdate transport systems ATPase subunit
MRELLKSGVTIIFISHNIPLMQSLCQRLILLDHGVMLKEGAPDEVVPHYESLINRQREEDLRKVLGSSAKNESIAGDNSVTIDDVALYDANGQKKDSFGMDEIIKVDIHYESKQRIDSPNFQIEIVRADQVVCCSADTQNVNKIDHIQGKGEVTVYLKDLNLLPGVYFIRLAIFDKDMVHPYVFVKKGIFKINVQKRIYSDGVFMIDPKWEHRR